jgi:hypothetical protein
VIFRVKWCINSGYSETLISHTLILNSSWLCTFALLQLNFNRFLWHFKFTFFPNLTLFFQSWQWMFIQFCIYSILFEDFTETMALLHSCSKSVLVKQACLWIRKKLIWVSSTNLRHKHFHACCSDWIAVGISSTIKLAVNDFYMMVGIIYKSANLFNQFLWLEIWIIKQNVNHLQQTIKWILQHELMHIMEHMYMICRLVYFHLHWFCVQTCIF